MADNIWSSAGDTDGNTAGNWSLGHVPTAGETARFDATSVVNCSFSGAVACAGIAWYAGYTGTIAFGAHAHDWGSGLLFTGTGDHTATTTGTSPAAIVVNKSSGTVTASGWVTTSSTIDIVAGTFSCGTQAAQLYLDNITIRAGATLQSGAAGGHLLQGVIDNYGTIECQNDGYLKAYYGTVYNRAGGKITGAGNSMFELYGAALLVQDGVIDVPLFSCHESMDMRQLVAGTYAAATMQFRNGGVNYSQKFAGSYTFSGNVVVDPQLGGHLTLDLSTNAATLAIAGNLTFTHTGNGNIVVTLAGKASSISVGGNISRTGAGTGTDIWTKGTAATEVTFNGAGAQSIAFPATGQGPVVVNKASGTLTLAAALTCDALTITAGTVDPNGQTITTTGDCIVMPGANFSSDADAFNGCAWVVGGDLNWRGTAAPLLLNATAGWTLTVTGVAYVSRATVAYSDASGGTLIPDHNGTNGGNNTNWTFPSAGARMAMFLIP